VNSFLRFLGQYLSPDNFIALVVVIILVCVFVLWVLGLLVLWSRLRARGREMSACKDITKLVESLKTRTIGEGETTPKAELIFTDFCREKSVSKQSPVSNHLRTIFLCGWTETRLEVSELLNHTALDLFKWNNSLRSVLAVFIVVGLLGTLFGLADSLAQLSPALDAKIARQTNEGLTQALGHLLAQMKSAFAPSMWGIFFTILGVLLYGLYLQVACSPVRSMLERLTVSVWVPQLYPTTSQRLIETLQQSEQQMRKGFDTATRVNELVTTVQDEISDFNQNLSRANDIIEPLSQSTAKLNAAATVINEAFAERLNAFSGRFTEDVSRLTQFQGDIRALYQQVIEESEAFHRNTKKTLADQNKRMADLLKGLKTYEDAYLAERGKIDTKLQRFLDEATEANTSTNAENRKLMEQTRDQLIQRLGEIDDTLRKAFSAFTQKLDSFDIPVANAARTIEGTQANFVTVMERIVGDLQQEFHKQNSNNKQQLDALTSLNQRIETLLTQLTQHSETQSVEVHTLSQSIGSLQVDIRKLTANMDVLTSDAGTLSQAVKTIESHAQALGETTQKFAEGSDNVPVLVSSITTLAQSVSVMAQQAQIIRDSASKLADSSNPMATLISQMEVLNQSIKALTQHIQTVAETKSGSLRFWRR